MSASIDYSPSSSASSSSSSTSSSSVHPASLLSPSMHAPAVLEMVEIKITRPVIEYIVDCTIETVDFAMGRPTSSRGRTLHRNPFRTRFTSFVTDVVTTSEVSMPTLIAALAYITRAQPYLNIAREEWALERVFLGALIVASKYTNDHTLKNIHWAACTGIFCKRDVGRVEREFLSVLDWDLVLSESDLLNHHDGLTLGLHKRNQARCPHPAFASQPEHKHFVSIATSRVQHFSTPILTSPPCPCPSPSFSSSSDEDSTDSPRTPPDLSPFQTRFGNQTRSDEMDLLKKFPLPPVPHQSIQLL
ncbi:hypothetical protein DL96DRAFT_1539655 [Flagelloscypha sp. PMI_526]|nr:hypothetical protein DL96DRAFT_1539655 [Flagelloscypha sp. PMI_526]